MEVASVTNLREIRERQLYASREDVIRRTRSVSIGTIRNAERGGRIRRSNAYQLLDAINSLLLEREKSPVAMVDLGVRLYQ